MGQSRETPALDAVMLFTSVLNRAREIAIRHHCELIMPSHFLLSVLDHGPGAVAFSDRGGDPELAAGLLAERMGAARKGRKGCVPGVHAAITRSLDDLYQEISRSAVAQEGDATGKHVFAGFLDTIDACRDIDALCMEALDRALGEPLDDVDPDEIDRLLEIAEASDALMRKPEDRGETPGGGAEDPFPPREGGGPRNASRRPGFPGGSPAPSRPAGRDVVDAATAVDRALRCLGTAVAEGRIDPVIGRDAEIDRVVAALMRRRKSSVILHGEAGVGKTAIAEGVAVFLRSAAAPEALRSRPIYELSLSEMVSGTRYRGDFEERVTCAVRRIRDERAIVFVDEVHTLMGLGSSQSNGMDAANILKPALARGEMSMIGATTTDELDALRQDKAVMRRFEFIEVVEPSRDAMRAILDRSAWTYLRHHRLGLEEAAAEEILRITELHQPEARYPDKAFDLLDRACVTAVRSGAGMVRVHHVEMAARLSGIRLPAAVTPADISRFRRLKQDLLDRLPDEPEAVAEVVRHIGAREVFCGATPGPAAWVVVAEDAQAERFVTALSAAFCVPVTRFDRHHLSDPGAGAWLVGVPAWQGATAPGALVRGIERRSDALLVFERVDMCSTGAREVIATLLRSGQVRTACGRTVPAARCRVLMTVSPEHRSSPGFLSSPGAREAPGEQEWLSGVPRLHLAASPSADAAMPVSDALDTLLGQIDRRLACRVDRDRVAEMVSSRARGHAAEAGGILQLTRACLLDHLLSEDGRAPDAMGFAGLRST